LVHLHKRTLKAKLDTHSFRKQQPISD